MMQILESFLRKVGTLHYAATLGEHKADLPALGIHAIYRCDLT
jgi:hypothetical protein